jgi:hypothetical protein
MTNQPVPTIRNEHIKINMPTDVFRDFMKLVDDNSQTQSTMGLVLLKEALKARKRGK